MLRSLKRLARACIDLLSLAVGWITYGLTGRTPHWAGMSLIRLFCVSGGRSNDLMARLVSWRFPPVTIAAAPGVLPAQDARQLAQGTTELRQRGYHVLEHRVPDQICDRLLDFALTQPAILRVGEGQAGAPATALYDPQHPQAVRYEYAQQVLIDNPDIQKLMADPALISVAQAYLGAEPIADVIGMWWHTAYSDKPDSEAAQFYHFDMDRIKWVKFFICLTDVASDNGPHFFVAGSHRTDGIPRDLLAKGYVRLVDDEVAPRYAPQDVIEFTAPRGTIIAEDTRGLHKGQHVRSGHRLMLQIQFSNSLFGPAYPKLSFGRISDPGLADAARLHPRIFSAYLPVRS